MYLLFKKRTSLKELEVEWNKYKYVILESNTSLYDELETRIKEHSISPIVFYEKVEEGLNGEKSTDNLVLAAKKVFLILSYELTDKEDYVHKTSRQC